MAESIKAEGKLVACRLPLGLLDQAQRYSDLYHTTVSQLIREALTFRLAQRLWPPGASSAGDTALPPHLDALLADLAVYLGRVQEELQGARIEAPTPLPERLQAAGAYAGVAAIAGQGETPAPAAVKAPEGYYLGKRCPDCGDDWQGTGKSLRLGKGYKGRGHCAKCRGHLPGQVR